MTERTTEISAIVPVFRSAPILPELHRRLSEALTQIAERYEIILVEDGGGDGSWDAIEGLARQDDHVRGIRMSRNYGQHNALLCGIRLARYPVIVTLDDDLQNPPEEIGKLLARNVSAFRVFRTRIRDAFETYRGPYVSIDVLLTWGTTKFAHLPVRHEPRQVGKSTYTVRKLVTHAFNMMTGFSTLPLQVASLIGFLINGSAVPGFAFLASMIAIFSGAQLFALGIIGEYLARMHFRAMDRPTYLVQQVTDDE